MKRFFAFILPLFLFTVNLSAAQLLPTCEAISGRVEQRTYNSALLETAMRYSIYLPPCYDQTIQDYPVVYLMHGSNSDDTHWLVLGLPDVLDHAIVVGDLPPMIVVLPYGDWIANENRFDSVSWSNVFLNELLPDVEVNYRVQTEREGRGIGGISRGGFWAFNLALRYPNLFGAVGGHSAFFDDDHAPPDQNPLDLALNAGEIDALRIWLDRGRDDYAAYYLDVMDQHLRQRNLPNYVYNVYPRGEHNNAYWGSHLLEYLQFYSAAWRTGADVALTPIDAAPRPVYLLLPAVAFPSTQAAITLEQLRAVREGQLDQRLVVDQTTANTLAEFGVSLNSQTRVVADEALRNELWRDRTLYTLLSFDRMQTNYRVLNLASANGDDLHPLDSDLLTYPFVFESAAPNFDPSKLTRIVLSGVTAITRSSIAPIDQNGIVWAGSGIRPYVNRADFFHTSNEVSFSPRCPASDIEPLGAFCSKDAHFDLLRYVGVDIVELSGNHNADYGYDAYLRSLDMYAEAGMATIGGGATLEAARQPLIIEHNGGSIAMLACNWVGPYYALANDGVNGGEVRPGAAYCDTAWLRELLPALDAEHDLVIVTVQYTETEIYVPTDNQMLDFRFLADLGADVVIGTQAHKPQTFEFYGQSFLHYGLGNLFFDQPFWGNVRFFMDQLFIYDGRLHSIDLFTGIIDDLARPRPMLPDERENFLFFMFVDQGGM